MIALLARQSVILKCNLAKSQLLGNYEFYYAAGLLTKILGKKMEHLEQPEKVQNEIVEMGKSYQTDDNKVKHLINMLGEYKVHETFDEQMKKLFEWGYNEPYIWQVNVPI